jgi:ribosomal protein S18 acetylase RimI-like enzyme
MRIQRLVPADAVQYRELMLEAYELAADAFTSTAQERALEPLSWWQRRIASAEGLSQALGAFDDAADGAPLVGTVTVEYSAKPKTRHNAVLIGMYVRAAHRGQGVARALVQAALAAAASRAHVQGLRLTVTEGNAPAIGLYESVGFEAWGTEPLAIQTASGFKGKVHMSLALARAAGDV